MDLKLRGRRAVVLGGTRGIGRAVAETLADEGVDIALCARSGDAVAEAVTAITQRGVRALGEPIDVGDGEALRSWIGRSGQELGGIDILVANAGAIALAADVDSWHANFRVDILGAVNAVEAARPLLEAAGERHGDAAVILVASLGALETSGPTAYGSLKAALIHHAKGLARQLAPRKVRVNVVSPGAVLFEDGVWGRVQRENPKLFDRTMASIPAGRMATVQDIAYAAAFLASPLSSYTTGINLLIDGAMTRRVNF